MTNIRYDFKEHGFAQATSEKALFLTDFATNNTDVESLDQQVKSMMLVSENENPYQKGKARICKVCGKEGSMQNIMEHIEANHITEISIPCDLCGKFFTSRRGLRHHKSQYHRST